MKRVINKQILILILSIACLVSMTGMALALTAAGTTVSNSATVSYSVGGISQDLIESSPDGNSTPGAGNGTDTTFKVDQKIDFTVTRQDNSPVVVLPGSDTGYITFLVSNSGNDTQDFYLSQSSLANGNTYIFGSNGEKTDNFDATSVVIYVDTDGDGVLDEDEKIEIDYIDELAPEESREVYIVANIPLGLDEDDVALYSLTARAADGGGSGTKGTLIALDDIRVTRADSADTVEIVLADTDRNNSETDTSGFIIQLAGLSVKKEAEVVDDPINGISNPKAIPGATIKYTITVTNSGNQDATSVVVTDAIPDNTTFVGSSVMTTGTVEYSCDGTSWSETPPDPLTALTHIRVTSLTVVANNGTSDGEAIITFQVTID